MDRGIPRFDNGKNLTLNQRGSPNNLVWFFVHAWPVPIARSLVATNERGNRNTAMHAPFLVSGQPSHRSSSTGREQLVALHD